MMFGRSLGRLALLLTVSVNADLVSLGQTQRASVSTAEMLKILKIQTFRVRTPADPYVWNIVVLKKQDVRPPGQPKSGFTVGTGLLAFRDTGEDVYEFTLPEHDGAFTQGKFDLCKHTDCAGQYSLKWLKTPRYSNDGDQCLLAEFENLGEDAPSAYIALVRTRSHE